jgi:NtrC-family two-component system sensor histidine kinase KinB
VIQSIRAKIILTFAALVVLNLAAGFWAIYNVYTMGTTVGTIVRENYRSVVATENIVKSLERKESFLRFAADAETDADGSRDSIYQESKELLLYWVDQAVIGLNLPSQFELRDSLQSAYREYARQTDEVYAAIKDGAHDEARRRFAADLRTASETMRSICYRLFEVNQEAMTSAESRTHSLANQTAFGTLIASVIALALSVLATGWLMKSVITPAEELTETVKRIGRGRLDLKIDVHSDDEIGQLSREFNKMTERLHQFEQMNIDRILAEKRKSEAIVESISDGLIVTDARLAVIHLNRVARDLFGVAQPDPEGKALPNVIKDARIVSLLTDYAVTGQAPAQRQKPLSVDSGDTVLYYRPRVSRIHDAEGNVFGLLLVLQDVTQFEELDRMKSDFIATLSHEFRTPVTSISMSVDILGREILGALNDRQKELVESAKQDSQRLAKLARELLQLSRLEAGRVELREEHLDIGGLVRAAVRSLQVQFQDKGVLLETDIEEGLPSLVGDEQQISSVITNLASNALRFTGPGGTVTVRTRQDRDSLVIAVEDTGQGIPRTHLDDIFDKFVQVKRSAESTPGSVGLGLAIAKEVVELYGGKIWAESELGHGSTFTVRLPVHSAHTPSPEESLS